MTATLPRLPEYTDALFVARTKERKIVLDKIKEIIKAHARQKIIDRRTIVFMGQRNMGKTWLLGNLEEELKKLNVSVLKLDMEAYCHPEQIPDKCTQKPIEVVKEIIDASAEKLHLQHPVMQVQEAREITGKSKVFIEAVQQKLQDKPLVVLLDSVFEADWEFLGKLEDYFLGPLAIEPWVLLVLTGRGRAYPWKTPELRLRADFNPLEPFTKPETEAQLKKIAAPKDKASLLQKSAEINKLSNGNPGAAYFLAQSPEDPVSGINQAIDDILAIAGNKAPTLREYLTALAPLRTFDEERIQAVLPAVYPDKAAYSQLTYRQAREIRESIVKHAFARWDDASGGYKLDNTVANLLKEYLKRNKKDIWQRVHCAAYKLYKQWAEQYPATKDSSLEEAAWHQEKLEEAGFSIDQCNG